MLASPRGEPVQNLFDPEVVVEEVIIGPENSESEGSETRFPHEFPGDVALLQALFPEEAALVAGAVRKRQREFAAGRFCARRALSRLGIEDFVLLSGHDRTPIWPPGVVGSISHSRTRCVAVVARRGDVLSLGVDLESPEGLPSGLWASVLTETDHRWLRTRDQGERPFLAKLIFSAKECTYKCRYPVTGERLEFTDVDITVDSHRGVFRASVHSTASPGSFLEEMTGRFYCGPDRIVTAMTWKARFA